MCAIDAATVKRSLAQLRLRQPRTETAAPLASTALSTSALSSSTGEVTLEAIMAQLVHKDACLDTLSDELCQANTPSMDESDDGCGSDDATEDDDDGLPSDDEMST
ncbi:hypothetical protein SO802_023508 [Lithocarpus litseifolius]|uniref:Uncharacterized protein n=1 Tax=Lithocarpus litseifolius TaxID=425828 RepID=A0AAW2C9V8_9ROSI